MALKTMNFISGGQSVRLRFDGGVSVEAKGHYFTLDIEEPLAVSVSDRHIVFVLDRDSDNLMACTLDGCYAFGLSSFGLNEQIITGSVMTAGEAIVALSRYPQAEIVKDHTYYLATTASYGMLWFDLDEERFVIKIQPKGA